MANAAVAGHRGEAGPKVVTLLAIEAAGLLAWATWIIVGAMGDLRGAYLYRERTGEGIGFFQVGLRFIGGGIVAVAGVGLCALGARSTAGRVRLAFIAVGALVLVALAACAAVAMWVSSRTGCIGPCG